MNKEISQMWQPFSICFNFLLYGCYSYGQYIFKIPRYLRILIIHVYLRLCHYIPAVAKKQHCFFTQQLLRYNKYLIETSYLDIISWTQVNNVINRNLLAWKLWKPSVAKSNIALNQTNFVNFLEEIELVTRVFY